MSLIGWWKLDGDAVDSSVNKNDGTITSATTSAGVIGQCLNFNGVDEYVKLNSDIYNNTYSELSISFWINTNTDSPSTYGMAIYRNNDTTIGTSTWFGGVVTGTNELVATIGSGSGPGWTGGRTGIIASSGTWYHVVCSWNGTTAITYVNGIQKVEYALLASNFVNKAADTRFGASGDASGYLLNALVDDVRIYNHALSLKEVKDLSQAKVLHYKMDNFQEPTTNIYDLSVSDRCWSSSSGNICTFKTTTSNNSYTIIGTASPVGCYAYVYPLFTTTNVHHTLSFNIKNNDNVDLTVSIKIRDGNNGSNLVSAQVNIINEGQTKYLTVTTTTPVSLSQATASISLYCNATDGYINAEVTNIQFESKDHATPFVVGSRLGTVYDSSGYDNHGTLTESTTPHWVDTSKIGTGCYKFNGTDEKITVPYNSSFDFERTDSFSICLWCKRNAYGGTILTNSLGTYGSPGYGITDYSSESQFRIYLSGTTNGNDLIKDFNYPTGYINQEWGFLVVTYDGSISYNGLLLYWDGVAVSGDNIRLTLTETTLINNPLLINRNDFDGDIDDVRIYGTVLSSDYIKELYNVRASIDEYGNFYAQEFIEYNTYDESIGTNNLVLNGNLKYEDNTNFSSFTYDIDKYLYRTNASFTYITSDYIPIDEDCIYAGQCDIKDGTIGVNPGNFYYGYACYDKDYNFINYQSVTHYTNTETTLASTLSNGDTTVYLTSAVNWQISTASTSLRYIAVWNTGEYPDYTYTKLYEHYTNSETSGNTVTLDAAWDQGTISAGTPVANASAGSTYNYKYASNVTAPLNWTTYGGITYTSTGWVINQGSNNFRYGTKYIRMLFLMNRNAVPTTTTTYMKDIKFWNTTKGQLLYDSNNIVKLESNGAFNAQEFDEVGPTLDLEGWWKFDEGTGLIAYDSSGNKNNGNLINTPIWVSGINGNAIEFDGTSNQYINCNLSDNCDFTTEDFSISFWQKGETSTSDNIRLICRGIYTVEGWEVFSGGGLISLRTYNGSSYEAHCPIDDDGEFHHVVITKSGTEVIMYIDKDSKSVTGSACETLTSSDEDFLIGIYYNRVSYEFNGIIDDVRVYSRLLSASEVNQLYNYGLNTTLKMYDNGVLYTKEINELI